jgi:hypothetical protein
MTSPRGATPVAPLSDPGVTGVAGVAGVAGVTGVVEAAPATPAPAAPTAMASARSSESEGAAPAQAVLTFYALAAAGQFDGAARLWSPQMLVAYPPGEHVTQRFSQTRELTVRRAEVVSLDETTGRASVAVDLVEVLGTPPVTRRYVGTWQLVRGPGGWLLDQPNLRAE